VHKFWLSGERSWFLCSQFGTSAGTVLFLQFRGLQSDWNFLIEGHMKCECLVSLAAEMALRVPWRRAVSVLCQPVAESMP
jgi:hypothetical protein